MRNNQPFFFYNDLINQSFVTIKKFLILNYTYELLYQQKIGVQFQMYKCFYLMTVSTSVESGNDRSLKNQQFFCMYIDQHYFYQIYKFLYN